MTASEKKTRDNSKVKAGYYTVDGTRVPGVTTVLNVIAKPALIKWANNLGLQGIDSTKYVDALADVGTLAHAMILADLRGEDPAACGAEHNKTTIDLAENCFCSYLSWRKGKTICPEMIEKPLVSEVFRYGGRSDFYGDVDGIRTLMDFKTGKGIWPEHWYQLSAYSVLIAERGDPLPQKYVVLNIPRAETEAFDIKERSGLKVEWEIFKSALNIYRLQKELEK
jgi:hypothetical protein